MKILMITPYLPYPLSSGGQIRSYNLLKNLSKKHIITLFSFVRHDEEKKHISHLLEFCKEVKVFLKRPPWSITSLVLSGMTVYPLVVCLYLKRFLRREIEAAIRREKFDIIHAETFYVMPNIPPNNIPTILVEQTIEYLVYKHYTESVSFPPLKWLMEYDVNKIIYWEKKFWKIANRVVAMSEADRKVMHKEVPKLGVDIVPNGVDTDFFKLKRQNRGKAQTVLFVGNFKWLQNREAVKILISKIWPVITSKLPDSRLWIVGRFPPYEIIKYASPTIRISDNIDDIREAYNNADVMLAPIYGPGGTRYKILECMATGIPVVTTSIGIEGLDAHANEVLIGNSFTDLARQTVRVMTDSRLYRKLALNGRRLVERNFSWSLITGKLDRIYAEAAHGKKT